MIQRTKERSSRTFLRARTATWVVALHLLSACTSPAADTHDHSHPDLGATDENHSVEYVCPMHPQIRQAEFGTCPICLMDLVPVSRGGEESVIDVAQYSAGTAALMGLATQKAERATPSRTAQAFGRVVSAHDGEARVVAWAEGRIEALLVNKDGQSVRAGDTVARVFSPDIASLLATLRDDGGGGDDTSQSYDASSGVHAQLRRAARQQLRDRGLSDRDIDALARSRGSSIPLRAAHAGTVIDRHVRVGDYVATGDPIVSLAQTSAVWVELSVDPATLAHVKLGAPVRVTIDGSSPATGTVAFIAPTLDADARRGRVRVTLDAATPAPRLGSFVRAEFPVAATSPAVLVDDSAVLWTGQRSVVFVVDRLSDPPIYQPVDVVVGERWGDQRVILEGLYPGEEVVREGAFRIDATLYLRSGGGMLRGGDHE